MGNYPAYPAYQDSGIPWLGDIPAHWEVATLKRVADFQGGTGFPDDVQGSTEQEIPFYKVADMNLAGKEMWMSDAVNSVSREVASELRAHIIPAGSILFPKVGAALRLNKRRIATRACCIDNNMMSVMVKSCDMKWLYYWLIGLDLTPFSNPGAVPSINEGQIRVLPLPVPRASEQRAIARFLDQKTAQIDALIAKKQALLAALAEKRRALITHAVTRGLDPAAPLRDSGIPWLGEIPAHWEVVRLRFRLSVNPGKREVRLSGDSYVSFVPMEAVGEYGGLDLSIEKSIDEIGSGYTFFTDGDIVVAKITPCFENGKGAIATGLVNGMAFGTTELHVLRPGSSMCARFLFYLTISSLFRKLGEAFMYGAGGQKRIPDSFIKNLKIGIPPLTEQRAIAHYLDQMSQRMAEQTEKIHAAIAALREYRAALITHAVTGQIDVRGLPLSPEPE